MLLSIADLIHYRQRTEPQVRRGAVTSLPTDFGRFRAVGYVGAHDGAEHMALVVDPTGGRQFEEVPVHVHTECLSGDVFRSTACGCRQELEKAMFQFCAEGCGVVLYLRPPGGPRACGIFATERNEGVNSSAMQAVADWILADLASTFPAADVSA